MKKQFAILTAILCTVSSAANAGEVELGVTQYLKQIPGHARECALRSARRIPVAVQSRNDNMNMGSGTQLRYGTTAENAAD